MCDMSPVVQGKGSGGCGGEGGERTSCRWALCKSGHVLRRSLHKRTSLCVNRAHCTHTHTHTYTEIHTKTLSLSLSLSLSHTHTHTHIYSEQYAKNKQK